MLNEEGLCALGLFVINVLLVLFVINVPDWYFSRRDKKRSK